MSDALSGMGGLGGLVTGGLGVASLFGADTVPRANPPNPGAVGGQYLNLVRQFAKGQPTVFQTEQTWKPQYLALDSSLLPTAVAGVRGANPQATTLLDKLTTQANEGLDAGAGLDPGLMRLSQQGTRAGQAARGLGYGPGDALSETLGMLQMGQSLRTQRQQFGQGVAEQLFRQQTAPGFNLLGSATPTIMPSNDNYDIFNTAYNANAASNISYANAQTAMLQGFNSAD